MELLSAGFPMARPRHDEAFRTLEIGTSGNEYVPDQPTSPASPGLFEFVEDGPDE